MKPIYLKVCLACLFPAFITFCSFAQQPCHLPAALSSHIPRHTHQPVQRSGFTGKTSALNVETLGYAAFLHNFIYPQRNYVLAVDSLDLVAVCYLEQLTAPPGGVNKKLRFDYSTLGGFTGSWQMGNGPLNPTLTRHGRFPQIALANPDSSINPFDSRLIWTGATLDTSGYDGLVQGISDFPSGPVTVTEHYSFQNQNSFLPMGLCPGKKNEFWTVELAQDIGGLLDSLHIYKGVWNYSSGDVDWNRHTSPYVNYNKSFDGSIHASQPNMAFSPDGQHGWIFLMGDIAGGDDSVYAPVFLHSADFGATWSAPQQVDLRTLPGLSDSLHNFHLDSAGMPLGTGRPTSGTEFDMTVDADGNPHVFFTTGNATIAANPIPGYVIYDNLELMGIDLFSTDGGLTWDWWYVGPILTFINEAGGVSSGSPLVTENYPQVSRSSDGDVILYSWTDTDTCKWGAAAKNFPNLRVRGKRISDDFCTIIKFYGDGDILWDGQILCPSAAPELTLRGTAFHQMTAFASMTIAGDETMPCNVEFIGNDVWMDAPEFMDFATYPNYLDRYSNPCGYFNPVSIAVHQDPIFNLGKPIPNPASESFLLEFNFSEVSNLCLQLTDLQGKAVRKLADKVFQPGRHALNVSCEGIAPGIYIIQAEAGTQVTSQKLAVVR